MKTIDLGNAKIYLVDDHIVLFEANADVVIDKDVAQSFYDGIEAHVAGSYSLIINRKNKYQLLRFEVFHLINSRVRLQSLAIVAPKDSAQKMAQIEAPLCQKPFATFSSVDDAVAWLKTFHQE
jgi:hypothetical protein